jgi:hypothetical protein
MHLSLSVLQYLSLNLGRQACEASVPPLEPHLPVLFILVIFQVRSCAFSLVGLDYNPPAYSFLSVAGITGMHHYGLWIEAVLLTAC